MSNDSVQKPTMITLIEVLSILIKLMIINILLCSRTEVGNEYVTKLFINLFIVKDLWTHMTPKAGMEDAATFLAQELYINMHTY